MNTDLWTYREDIVVTVPKGSLDLTGFKIEARDGSIGKIDEATNETGRSWAVVDTGPWIFGKKVLLPAGVVNHVDHEEKKIYVDRSKDQIKSAPEFNGDATDPVYRDKLGGYYGDTYGRM